MENLKAFNLDKLNLAECFPAGFDQQLWYGIYFINEYSDPSIVMLNADFGFVTNHSSKNRQGYLVLFNHHFLPQRLTEKLHKLPLFFQQGCGPFALNKQQVPELNILFGKICSELLSDYRFKKELLATWVTQLLHFVIKNFTVINSDTSCRFPGTR